MPTAIDHLNPPTGQMANNVVGFARALRAAGLPVGPGSVIDAMNALQVIDIGNRADVYTTLESIFVKRHEQALIDLLTANPHLLNDIEGGKFKKIVIKAYRDAFNIIGDPAKRDPHNRQSADHSMCYIIATLIRKALETKRVGWKELMLVPEDYAQAALFNPVTRRLMSLIHFEWGGPTFDAGYPEGIPTSMDITDLDDRVFSSGLVMFPGGHAANHRAPNPVAFDEVVRHKWQTLGALAVADPSSLVNRYMSVGTMSHADLLAIDQLPFAIGEATAI